MGNDGNLIEPHGLIVPPGLLWRSIRGFEWHSDLHVTAAAPPGKSAISISRRGSASVKAPRVVTTRSGANRREAWLVPIGVDFPPTSDRPFFGSGVERLALRSARTALSDFRSMAKADQSRLPQEVLRFAGKYGWLGRPTEVRDGPRILAAEPLSMWEQELQQAAGVWELIDRTKTFKQSRAENDRRSLRELVTPQAVVAPRIPSPLPDLKQITDLKAQGIVTDEEFQQLQDALATQQLPSKSPTTASRSNRPIRPVQVVVRLPGGAAAVTLPTRGGSLQSDERLMDLAYRAAIAIIESKLSDAIAVRIKLPPDGGVGFEPTSLRAALYLELASQTIASDSIRRICVNPDCQRAFSPHDRRQLYHDDACKMRHHRKKKREAQMEEGN